jgi:hypothetical protein
VAVVVLVTYGVLLLVVLLNMLIAVVSHMFAEVKELEDLQTLKNQAAFICRLDVSMCNDYHTLHLLFGYLLDRCNERMGRSIHFLTKKMHAHALVLQHQQQQGGVQQQGAQQELAGLKDVVAAQGQVMQQLRDQLAAQQQLLLQLLSSKE